MQLMGLLIAVSTLFFTGTAQAADIFNRAGNVPRVDAFEHITGIREGAFKTANKRTQGQILEEDADGGWWVTNSRTGRRWYAGTFIDPTVAELGEEIEEASRGRKAKKRQGRFNVVVGHNPQRLSPQQRRQIDITALQADPANAYAVFQVASRHNCLEGAGEDVTDYTHVRAQGELAAVSAMPGTIVRRYGLPPIDLLRDLASPLFRLGGRGAYKTFSLRGSSVADLRKAAKFDPLQVRVGIHMDTQVSFGMVSGASHMLCLNEDQHIIQVYTAAVDMGLNDASYFSKTAYSYVETIAQQMLIAAYEGTLLAAVRYGEQISELKHERQQVFLTLMGCGVFNNKLEWVERAIEHGMDAIVDHNLDVTLVVFDAASHADMPEFLAAMRAHVDATHGTYTDIR